jgi:hypothetical protein
MRRTKTAQTAIAELYAVLAKAAAQRAVNMVKDWGNTAEAERLADQAVKWIDKSSADAIRWSYDKPRLG